SMAVAAVTAVVIELLRIRTRGRFPLSSVSIGLGVVLPPDAVICMFIGALLFWIMHKRSEADPQSPGYRRWVEGAEPICAGLISGAALMGIGNALLNVLI
ncbi:MAG TPA: OPT/YSL family transporter, partial [Burkholderiaceae bacterium]|nr:OPT/YSL family transporter [Burkholderiaceae bacterium]